MYLGQCMQMQSDNSAAAGTTDASKPALVPFRQCKLTELLFSNSYPSGKAPHATQSRHAPQKAVMIVTADPRGDFNATSQILRYSALAREVTVPRIPSITSTILSGTTAVQPSLCASTTSHDNNPTSTTRTSPAPSTSYDIDDAVHTQDISALAEELAILRLELAEERRRRREMEASWAAAERRADEVEADVRDECCAAFEAQMVREKARWRAAWQVERERGEAHVDEKIGILARGVAIWEDVDEEEGESGVVGELERENEVLRERVEGLERELRERQAVRTPSRKLKVLKARKWNVEGGLDGVENESP